MIYRTFILIPTLGFQVLGAQSPDSAACLERLTRLHTRVYAADDLLTTPYRADPDDVADWRRLMADIASLAAAPGQQEITEILKLLQAASEELIRQRRQAWEAVRPGFQEPPPAGGRRLDYARLDLRKVVQGDLELQARAEAVDRAYGWAKGLLQGPLGREPRCREALTVLRRLAYLLQATLEKYDRNVQALVQGKSG